MDAPTHHAPPSGGAPVRLPIARDELRNILSNLNHELCRPLISLRAGFDLILGDPARPIAKEQRCHLETMVAVCDRLLGLTRNYLDYAGLIQGARPLSLGTFRASTLIRDIDREFAAKAAALRLGWECSLEGADGTVSTDASRCQQIFGHLVANALTYTPEGGCVRVTGRVGDDHWVVTVTDTGPGIPANALAKVFEPFYRVSRDEHPGTEGNGLGLAICREMVEQLRGEITLHSTVGQGTRVTVRFPINASHPVARSAQG
jgi:signal transduction histidine kinase